MANDEGPWKSPKDLDALTEVEDGQQVVVIVVEKGAERIVVLDAEDGIWKGAGYGRTQYVPEDGIAWASASELIKQARGPQ